MVELLYQGGFNVDFPADVAIDHAANLMFFTVQSGPTLLNGSLVRHFFSLHFPLPPVAMSVPFLRQLMCVAVDSRLLLLSVPYGDFSA